MWAMALTDELFLASMCRPDLNSDRLRLTFKVGELLLARFNYEGAL